MYDKTWNFASKPGNIEIECPEVLHKLRIESKYFWPYKHPIRVRLLSYTRDGFVVLEGIDFESEMGCIRGGQLALVATARALDNWISEDLLGCWCQLSILG